MFLKTEKFLGKKRGRVEKPKKARRFSSFKKIPEKIEFPRETYCIFTIHEALRYKWVHDPKKLKRHKKK